MNIILLAAGLSKRMGKTNKMLIPVNGIAMVCHSAMNALKFLESANSESTLIVVTGYRHTSVEKALKPCRLFIENTKAPIQMVVVHNPDYAKGQFTSTKAGVRQVNDNEDFFICPADMPFITDEHYKMITSFLKEHDAVRPVVDGIPGHPVLLKSKMKKVILSAKNNGKVSDLLKKYDVFELATDDKALSTDIDTQNDVSCLLSDSVQH